MADFKSIPPIPRRTLTVPIRDHACPNRMFREFKQTEAQLIIAVDKWSHTLGYPGGFTTCGACSHRTQWGWCPKCQPTQYARLP